jgi:hypothetical protein
MKDTEGTKWVLWERLYFNRFGGAVNANLKNPQRYQICCRGRY